MVLLTGATLLGISFIRLMRVDLGFEPERLIAVHLRLPETAYPRERRIQFTGQAVERLMALPGIARVAVASGLPLESGAIGTVVADGKPEKLNAAITSATSGFFQTLGIPLVRGRLFKSDGQGSQNSLVVNESLARQYFHESDPLGRTLAFMGATGMMKGLIIGVVADTRDQSLAAEPGPQIYLPYAGDPTFFLKILVRTTGAQSGLEKAMRGTLRQIDPSLPIDRIEAVETLIAESASRQRFFTMLIAVFASLALLTAASGIYGVTMYAASRRTYEMGIRLALGARRWQIARLIVGRHVLLAALGAILGLLGALGTNRLLSVLLYQVTPTEPLVFLAAGVALVFVAAFASYLPARRASHADPLISLRSE